MTHDSTQVRQMTDAELLAAYRENKTEAAGKEPALTPPEEDSQDAVREEIERRGLAPDREDVIPDTGSASADQPIVDDRA